MVQDAAWSIPIAFLAGSIPTGLLIGYFRGIDIRQHGSRNIGATNIGRVLGRPYFVLCLVVDCLKGLLPSLGAGLWLGVLGSFNIPLDAAFIWVSTMFAAVLGNIFNPWLKFKGGKGVATSIGAMMGVFPPLALPGLGVLATFLVVLRISRYVSFGSVCGACAFPLLTAAGFVFARQLGQTVSLATAFTFFCVAAIMGGLVVWTHRANITRLRLGTEPKIGARAGVAERAVGRPG